MISKERYLKCVKSLMNFYDYENAIYESSNGGIDLMNMDPLVNLSDQFLQLLEYCTYDDPDTEAGSNLSYFLFETDQGRNTDIKVTDENNNIIPLKTVDDLWNNFIVVNHPEVEDKNV